MLCAPTASELVEMLAAPEANVAVPMTADPSLKVTMPVGVAPEPLTGKRDRSSNDCRRGNGRRYRRRQRVDHQILRGGNTAGERVIASVTCAETVGRSTQCGCREGCRAS